jgi:nucleolar protein 56
MMQLYLVENLTGIYAVDDENNVKAMQTWPNDSKTIAKIMLRLRGGDNSVIGGLVSELESMTDVQVFSNNAALVESLKDELNITYNENLEAIRSLGSRLGGLAVDAGLIDEEPQYGVFSHEVLNEIARMNVHDKLSGREALLIPAVQLLGELDTVLNSLSGRMREWYGVHFPEMGNRVKEHSDYAKIIVKMGQRENITAKSLMEMSLKKKDAERIEEASHTSIGAEFDDVDMKAVSDFAQRTLDLYKYRDELTEYLSRVANEVAPNVAFIAGPVLAAKLIEKAGGLKHLGMIPSSTIQVLGAEKAMFRAVKSNAKPPKHGLLYQHPYVNGAPRNRRGNRARSLAAKIAIAARADVFSGDFIAEELVSQLEDF